MLPYVLLGVLQTDFYMLFSREHLSWALVNRKFLQRLRLLKSTPRRLSVASFLQRLGLLKSTSRPLSVASFEID